MTDVPNMTDREILIQQGTVLNKLCGVITELKSDNKVEHEKISVKVDSVVITKISNKLFFRLIAIIITIEIMLTSAVGVLSVNVASNTADIEHVEHKINRTYGGG